MNEMPGRSVSRSFSRGRASKRFRSRSGSRGSGMYAMATGSRSRSVSAARSVTRRYKSVSLNRHSYSRWSEPDTASVTGSTLPLDFEFKFSSVIASSEFGALYDQFKIDYVVVSIQLMTNPDSVQVLAAAGTGINDGRIQSTNWYPKFWYIRDYDGGSSETLSSIKERQGVKCVVMRPNKALSIKIRPMVAVQTYRTATTTGYGPKRMFLDFVNGTEVPHYGLKGVFDTLGLDPNDTYPFKFRYEVKYYFTCKNVR